ncbi:MAG: S41 family peptidase [Paramuribaculum sp.]|nr:S41 family peptidase [Paramuribaculum sp.]
MQPNNKKLAIWLPLIVAVAFAGGIWLGLGMSHTGSRNSSAQNKVSRILDTISSLYVDEVNTDSLLEASIPDIIAKLDPHSMYIPASDLQQVNEELDGSFSGVGISFTVVSDTIIVNEVISGGPAQKVGLMPGDRIVTINDSVAIGENWPQQRILKTLRGAKGSEVVLGIMRPSAPGKIYPYTVVRGDIPLTSIDASYMLDDNTGYVKVNKFGRNTYDEFFTSLVELSREGANRYIVDLRGNTGGFMEIAVLMANEFLPRGANIVSIKGRGPESNNSTFADGTGSFLNSELVVLIDEISASSSEIFAGAIQDNDRGLVVGRRSFGKGLVQRQFDMPDSSALRLTTARYYTPSGRCIQKHYDLGATEDYELDLLQRMNNGETLSADSVKLDRSKTFYTLTGREVYGGGGIMPDIFVPTDTSGYSKYYFNVMNAGLLHKFAFNYVDANRAALLEAADTDELLDLLPSDLELLSKFVIYASNEAKIPLQWYYINISRNLLVSQLKALIARDLFGIEGYYEVINPTDNTVNRALELLDNGSAGFPITSNATTEPEES